MAGPASSRPWLWCLCAALIGCAHESRAPTTPPATPASAPQRDTAAATVPARGAPPHPRSTPRAPAPVELPAVDALVRDGLAAHRMPGCVVVVGRRDGVIFQKAYGARAVTPEREPMTLDTVFDLASLTKPVATAASVQLLVEAGALSLDTRVSDVLPAVRGARRGEITVRQLLLHTSGLPNVNPLGDYAGGRDTALTRIFTSPLRARPGARYEYSDLGYILLGELVAALAGEPLDTFARRRVFAPLAMDETGFRPPATLLPRIAPTEHTDKRPIDASGKLGRTLIRGVVHDPRAYRLGGVAGNAGLFSTAHDLSRYARMLLGEGQLEGTRVLARASVQSMTRPHFLGGTVRTPGFDVDSDFSGLRGSRLGGRAFGHGGFTGTSLWLDPDADLFVLFLSNRVHPDGGGNVIRLVGDITDAVVEALRTPEPHCPEGGVLPGVDVLARRGFEPLRGKRVGLVTHDAARDAEGRRVADVLRAADGVELHVLFSPEHGLGGAHEGAVGDAHDPATGVRVYSLFGKTRKPTAAMLEGVDVLVVDLVDVGVRFFTYMSTVRRILEAAAEQGLPVMLLDRPNPLGGAHAAGPLLDEGRETFVNHHRLPLLHGMSAGELANLLLAERHIGARLEVVEADGWYREQRFTDTGLSWYAPSPNLPTPTAALLYPAVGLLESTNLSVGRGTAHPFEHFGAPWLDPTRLIAELAREELAAVRFVPTELSPTMGPYRGERIPGVMLEVTDPRTFDPVRTGLALARALRRTQMSDWKGDDLVRLLGNRRVQSTLMRGAPLDRIEHLWRDDLAAFERRRRLFLRYPDCATTAHPPR